MKIDDYIGFVQKSKFFEYEFRSLFSSSTKYFAFQKDGKERYSLRISIGTVLLLRLVRMVWPVHLGNWEKTVQDGFQQYGQLNPAHLSITERLMLQLDKAVHLVRQLTGGYTNNFFSAEDFSAALIDAAAKYKTGNHTVLDHFFIWFAPAGDWNDFTHHDGEELGNTIFSLILQLQKEDSR